MFEAIESTVNRIIKGYGKIRDIRCNDDDEDWAVVVSTEIAALRLFHQYRDSYKIGYLGSATIQISERADGAWIFSMRPSLG